MSLDLLLTALEATEGRLATLEPWSSRYAIEVEHRATLLYQLDRAAPE